LRLEFAGGEFAGGGSTLAEYSAGAIELIRRDVDVVVAGGPEMALTAAVQATQAIPIVMVAIDYDPVALGYVSGLARPGGNVTGVFFQQLELAGKRTELV
jgi:putative ABC transport system substrate-binding protein